MVLIKNHNRFASYHHRRKFFPYQDLSAVNKARSGCQNATLRFDIAGQPITVSRYQESFSAARLLTAEWTRHRKCNGWLINETALPQVAILSRITDPERPIMMPKTIGTSTKINDETPIELQEMAKAIDALPERYRDLVAPAMQRVVECSTRRRRILNLVQEALSQLRLDMKYLIFDLEATRRERDQYKELLEKDGLL